MVPADTGRNSAKTAASRASTPISPTATRTTVGPGRKAWAIEEMPSSSAQTPHSSTTAIAVSTGHTMATTPNRTASTPRTTSTCQLAASQLFCTSPPTARCAGPGPPVTHAGNTLACLHVIALLDPRGADRRRALRGQHRHQGHRPGGHPRQPQALDRDGLAAAGPAQHGGGSGRLRTVRVPAPGPQATGPPEPGPREDQGTHRHDARPRARLGHRVLRPLRGRAQPQARFAAPGRGQHRRADSGLRGLDRRR